MRGYSVAPVRPRGVRTIADIARFPAGSERAWMRPRPSIFRLLLHQFGVRSGKTPNEIPRPPVTSWRVTVEAWLRCPGLIVVRQNQKPNVTTTFSQMLVSQLSWTHMYADGAWARTNATLADGNNTYNATATDTYGRTASDSVTVNLPATLSFQYDGNGNLTNDGRRVLEYDFENQLTNVYVASGWRTEFRYDAFGRQRVRREYTWQSSAWVVTNEVRYVYDGMLAVQERDANNLAQVSYTRGKDLSGSLQGAGGIGGLLARTDNSLLVAGAATAHAYYHCDGNGNVTALVNTNGIILARYSYDPYGNLLGMSGPLAEANRYRFSSKEWNGNAGLYYYGYRFYDGGLQRWLNRDPLSDFGSMPVLTTDIGPGNEPAGGNGGATSGDFQTALARVDLALFVAMGNNPASMFDPFGLDPYDKFEDMDSAAKDGMCYIKKHPGKSPSGRKEELAAAIYKSASDGKFYYDDPNHGKGSEASSTPRLAPKSDKDELKGLLHDHLKGEDFSSKKNSDSGLPGDIELYKDKGLTGYLLTPSGDMKKFDPKNGRTTSIGGAKDCK